MGPATAGALFYSLVFRQLRHLRIEPQERQTKGPHYLAAVGLFRCFISGHRFAAVLSERSVLTVSLSLLSCSGDRGPHAPLRHTTAAPDPRGARQH
jgi:hypothetical protein